jgi:2,4-dienoyl-CoA reductase-like NADH-dependent reductase (Old Yellow Enzyme family)
MNRLFSPFRLRDVVFKNRIFVSPMCQYSSNDGFPTDWHLVHLGSRAVGGAALVMVEATAVTPEGRISPFDSGLWSEEHVPAFQRITSFLKEHGAVPGIQLAHAGRKASTDVPWRGDKTLPKDQGGWEPLAPSSVPFSDESPVPREMTREEIDQAVSHFEASALLARQAGFEVVEIHMAHGYLIHEFLSPLSNRRKDEYGGDFENRVRFPMRVASGVRRQWPENLPLFIRISCTDWADGGWDLEQSIAFCRRLKDMGIDLIDCSSVGSVPDAKIPLGVGYQTIFSAEIRRAVQIPTGTVGVILSPLQAEHILVTEQADCVLLAREMLRDPYWALHAATTLRVDAEWPPQYLRAKPR